MAKEIIIPILSEIPTEIKIVSWKKKVGDKVKKGDVLLEIEAEKVNVEVESYTDGTLIEIYVGEGEIVTPRKVVGLID